ncbi:MAG: gamma-butyrobetaine hydroxylase-like domain-containing protein, partial [Geitlerinemataceae cyanobacterium]
MTSKVIAKESFLTVAGKRFHYIWLRDNCLCPQCSHPTSFQKLYEISDFTSPPEPLSWEEQDGQLRITWNEDPAHLSTFPVSWLLAHAYDDESEQGSANQKPESDSHSQEILWDKAWIEANISGLQEALSSDSELWLNQLLTVGFTVLH